MSSSKSTIAQTHLAISAHASAIPADGEVPEWICIMPAGKFSGKDGRGPYENKDPIAIVTASMAPRGLVPLDYNHQTVFAVLNGGESPAAAWIDKMEVRDGAIWGHLADWTPEGQQSVASKAYRFVSPAFQHTATGVITRIDSVGLVNNPNLAGLPAIASHIGDHPNMDKFLQELRALLGLSADADESAILTGCKTIHATASAVAPLAAALSLPAGTDAAVLVTAVQAKLAASTGTPDPSKFVPMAAFAELQTQVAALVQGKAQTDAETAVASAMTAGKVTPAMKDWATGYAAKDLPGFQAWASAAPAIVAPGGASVMPGGTPTTPTATDAETLAVCSVLGISVEDFKKQAEKDAAK